MEQIIISKQKEDSENFQNFLQIVKQKQIKVMIVKAGDRINFDKNLYMDILWPTEKLEISENPLNNNSIVGKLIYKNFSMLFTGDIEELAEKEILKKYENDLDLLKTEILKVAHHGSKTSSKKELLKRIEPKYALIGVSANNNFGHPSDITLEILNSIDCKVYRTDENGEITIKSNGNWIKINK